MKYVEGAAAAVLFLKLAGPTAPGARSCRGGIESSVAALLAAADEFSRMQYGKGEGVRLCWNGKAVALRCQRLCCRLLRVLDVLTASSHDQKRLFTREMAIGLSKGGCCGGSAFGNDDNEQVFKEDEKASAGTFLFPLGYPFDFFRYS